MLSFEVLLSAMYLKDYKYINSLNIKSDCVVVNQCDVVDKLEINNDGRNITFLSSTERGLSRSRNMAISNAKADICILCDNDVEYVDGYEKIIINAFENNPDADLIVFFIKRKERLKPCYSKEKNMNYISVCKVFSPEVAFRKKSIEKSGVKFKESFGAGSIYSMGEENIFLYDCLKKKLKIKYIPIQIAELREEESTWFKGYNEKFFRDFGAIYYEMSHSLASFLIIQFVIRKYKLYKKEMTMLNALKYMFGGKREYREKYYN